MGNPSHVYSKVNPIALNGAYSQETIAALVDWNMFLNTLTDPSSLYLTNS